MSQPSLIVVDEATEEEVSKDQYVIDYLKSLIALEEAMEPYKEQNNWLTKDDIWSAVKAFRLYKATADMDDLNDMFELIEKQFGTPEVP